MSVFLCTLNYVLHEVPMDWLRYRKIYLITSLLMIGVGAFSLASWKLKLGVDFIGGTIAEYSFNEPISVSETMSRLKDSKEFEIFSIQEGPDNKYSFRMNPLSPDQKENLEKVLSEISSSERKELRFETVGPTIGPELIKKTIYAIVVSAVAILFWVAYQFRSLKFGTSAILAMLHDTFNLIGAFSLLGHFFQAEVDFLFVTAVLTTLSFSVHDTIVVYDRIRESQAKIGGSMYEIANKAISETMVRSLNNSFTIIFMLVALVLLGGETVKWFAMALLIGTVLGTYSSPFVAVPLLVTWDEVLEKTKLKK